ncbi:hypothetical protein [Calothrix rhizosoleniae]|nr:hypothetical protein [Calothrix rhizosoleniae]
MWGVWGAGEQGAGSREQGSREQGAGGQGEEILIVNHQPPTNN